MERDDRLLAELIATATELRATVTRLAALSAPPKRS